MLVSAASLHLLCPVFSVLLWDGFLMRLSGMNLKTKLMLREKLNQCQYLSIFYKMSAPVVLSILFQSHRDVKMNLIWYMTEQHFCFPFISLISSSIQRNFCLFSHSSPTFFFFEIINLSLCHFFLWLQVDQIHPVWGCLDNYATAREKRKQLLLTLSQNEADRLEVWAQPINTK